MTDITPDAAPARRRAATAVTVALLSGFARSILLTLAALLLWAALPAAWGWVPTTVQSDSMAPLIRTGDVIVSMRVSPDELQAGRDVLVQDPDHPGHLRLHRFVRFDDDGTLVTKGDANATEDSSHVRGGNLVGIAVVRVPYIGLPVVWLYQGRLFPLALAAAAIIGLAILASLGKPRRGGTNRPPARPSIVTAAALSIVVALAGVGVYTEVSKPASAGFFSASPNGGDAFAAASAYDCLSPAAPDAPYLLYRFSEVSGTRATDSSGNGRTGTLQGSVAREAGSCAPGSSPSIGLSGTSASVSTPSSVSSPASFTLETWFRTTSTSGGRLMGFGNAQTGTSSNTDRQLYVTAAGKVVFGVAPNGNKTAITSTASYNDGAWHLATATLGSGPGPDGGMRLSIDGVLVASNPQVTSGRTMTGFWRVGSDSLAGWANAPATTVLTGSIGSAAVYPAVLGPPQIQQHYAAGQ